MGVGVTVCADTPARNLRQPLVGVRAGGQSAQQRKHSWAESLQNQRLGTIKYTQKFKADIQQTEGTLNMPMVLVPRFVIWDPIYNDLSFLVILKILY